MKYLSSIIFLIVFTFSACKSSKIQESNPTVVEAPKPVPTPTPIPKTSPKTKPEPPKDKRFKTTVGEAIPDFSFAATDGKTYNISDFKGKVVWLNFFATWCGPCLVEIPELNELAEKHQDIVFISIGRNHTVEELIPFVKEKKMTYLVGADPGKKIFKLFGEQSIPRNYLINTKGEIEHQKIGYNETIFQKLATAVKTMK